MKVRKYVKVAVLLLLTAVLFAQPSTHILATDYTLIDIKIIRIYNEPREGLYHTGSNERNVFTVTACEMARIDGCWQVFNERFYDYFNYPQFLIDHRSLPNIGIVEGAIVRAYVREIPRHSSLVHLEIYDWELISRPPRNWTPVIISSAIVVITVGTGVRLHKKYDIKIVKREQRIKD